MKTYYALWMPTLTEKRPPFYCTQKVVKSLVDSVWLGGYFLKGRLDAKSLDVFVEYTCTGPRGLFQRVFRKDVRSILLRKESDVFRNGFVLYSYDAPDANLDELQKGLVGEMKSPWYHFVKGFYHKHTDHHSSQDSLLQAYSSEAPIDLKEQYDDIVNWYVDQYIELLRDFTEVSPGQIENAKSRITRIHKVQNGIRTLGDVITDGRELQGQLRYLDFLLDKAAHPYSIAKEKRTEIRQLRDHVRVLLDDAATAYSISTAALGVKFGIHGIKWGIGGILVSCMTFITSTYMTCTDRSMQQYIEGAKQDVIVKDSLNSVREIDSLKKELMLMKQFDIKTMK